MSDENGNDVGHKTIPINEISAETRKNIAPWEENCQPLPATNSTKSASESSFNKNRKLSDPMVASLKKEKYKKRFSAGKVRRRSAYDINVSTDSIDTKREEKFIQNFKEGSCLLNDLSPAEFEKVSELMKKVDLMAKSSTNSPRITVRRLVTKPPPPQSTEGEQPKKPAAPPRTVLFDVKVLTFETYMRKEYDRRYKRKRRNKKEKDKIQQELANLRAELFGHPDAIYPISLSGGVPQRCGGTGVSFMGFMNKDDDENIEGIDDTELSSLNDVESVSDVEEGLGELTTNDGNSFPVKGDRRRSWLCESQNVSALTRDSTGKITRIRGASVSSADAPCKS